MSRREGLMLLRGHQGKGREMPIGYDHMELIGDLDKSNLSGVEVYLEETEESGEGRGFVHLTV